MDRDAVRIRVKQIIASISSQGLTVDDIPDDEPLYSTDAADPAEGKLALDSLDIVEIGLELKSEFNVALLEDLEARRQLATVTQLVDYILEVQPGGRGDISKAALTNRDSQ